MYISKGLQHLRHKSHHQQAPRASVGASVKGYHSAKINSSQPVDTSGAEPIIMCASVKEYQRTKTFSRHHPTNSRVDTSGTHYYGLCCKCEAHNMWQGCPIETKLCMQYKQPVTSPHCTDYPTNVNCVWTDPLVSMCTSLFAHCIVIIEY